MLTFFFSFCSRQTLVKRNIEPKYGKIYGVVYGDTDGDYQSEPLRAQISLSLEWLKNVGIMDGGLRFIPDPKTLITQTASDSTGKFTLGEVKPGHYVLSFAANRCDPATLPDVQVAPDSITWLIIGLHQQSQMSLGYAYSFPQSFRIIRLPLSKEDSLQKLTLGEIFNFLKVK